MKTARHLLPLLFLAFLAFSACNAPGTSTQDGSEEQVDAPPASGFDEVPEHAIDAEVYTIYARFMEFYLGDSPHYVFEDQDGKQWDFADCDAKDCDFAMEVPPEHANEENQGWVSNPIHLAQWFELTYYEMEGQLYPDGPTGKMKVIHAYTPAP